VLADVVELPAGERRELVAELLATLDDGPPEAPGAVNAAWGRRDPSPDRSTQGRVGHVVNTAGDASEVIVGVEGAA
jgi:hypothetical protein